MTIYDAAGKRIKTLAERHYPAGHHEIVWNGASGEGRMAASGVYFVRMKLDEMTAVRKIVLLK